MPPDDQASAVKLCSKRFNFFFLLRVTPFFYLVLSPTAVPTARLPSTVCTLAALLWGHACAYMRQRTTIRHNLPPSRGMPPPCNMNLNLDTNSTVSPLNRTIELVKQQDRWFCLSVAHLYSMGALTLWRDFCLSHRRAHSLCWWVTDLTAKKLMFKTCGARPHCIMWWCSERHRFWFIRAGNCRLF